MVHWEIFKNISQLWTGISYKESSFLTDSWMPNCSAQLEKPPFKTKLTVFCFSLLPLWKAHLVHYFSIKMRGVSQVSLTKCPYLQFSDVGKDVYILLGDLFYYNYYKKITATIRNMPWVGCLYSSIICKQPGYKGWSGIVVFFPFKTHPFWPGLAPEWHYSACVHLMSHTHWNRCEHATETYGGNQLDLTKERDRKIAMKWLITSKD